MDLEDFDLNKIMNCIHEKVFLNLLCESKSGDFLQVRFGQLRHDCPNKTAKCVKEKVIG